METHYKRRNYYDTGGSGTIPTSRGEAARWWVPCQYTSVPRLLIATRLAIGPATIEDLQRVSGGTYCGVYQIVRNWIYRRFAAWTLNRGFSYHGGGRFRIVTLTQDGRKDLWRYAWVTRRLRFTDTQDAPLRDDLPDEPLEALRLNARREFLRPAALALLEELIGWPKQNCCQLGQHIDNYAAAMRYLRKFDKAGFVTDIGEPAMPFFCISYPRWVLNDYGRETLDRHIDALRRVAQVSGYIPTRSCEIYYPSASTSPCTWTMTPNTPPPCPDCPYYETVLREQQWAEAEE